MHKTTGRINPKKDDGESCFSLALAGSCAGSGGPRLSDPFQEQPNKKTKTRTHTDEKKNAYECGGRSFGGVGWCEGYQKRVSAEGTKEGKKKRKKKGALCPLASLSLPGESRTCSMPGEEGSRSRA